MKTTQPMLGRYIFRKTESFSPGNHFLVTSSFGMSSSGEVSIMNGLTKLS